MASPNWRVIRRVDKQDSQISHVLIQGCRGGGYALRNIIERYFNKLKNARRLAKRYDTTARSYSGFIHIVSMRLWMKQFVNTA